MRTIVAAAVLNVFVVLGFIIVSIPAHASIPCEDMLRQMRAGKATVALVDADAKRVGDLEVKAVERCNVDDDVRSDKFLSEAMTIIGLESKTAP